jgi:capsular exopolysaccharide synthesis family protein
MSDATFRPGVLDLAQQGTTISDLIRTVRRQARWAGAVALLVAVAVTGVTFNLQPRYTAKATIYVTPDSADPLAQPDAAPRSVADDLVATVADLLRGRDLATEVVQSLHLGEQPDPPSALHVAVCRVLPFLGRCGAPSAPSLDGRVDGFLSRLTVASGEHTRVIDLQYSDRNPARAARALNGLIAAYQDDQIATRTQDLQRTSGWLARRADSLRERWLQAEAKLGDYRAAHGLGAVGSTSPALIDQQIAHAAQDLSLAQSNLANAQARASAMQAGGSAAEMAEEPGVVGMQARLTEAEAADESLRSQYGPQHPRVLAAEREVAAARAGLAAEDGRIRHSVMADVAAKSATVATLTANLQSLRQQASRLSGTEVDLGTLTNEANEARIAYEAFQTRAKQVADRTQLLQPEIRFASHATPPSAPSFPNIPRFLAGGVALGLLAGLSVAVVREYFRHGLTNISRVSDEFSLPLLSVVPQVSGRTGQLVRYLEDRPFSDAAESIRGLAARLQLANLDAPKSVVIASATGGEGKTTLALWLAATLSAAGQKVLLIDGDHRRGLIAQTLGGDGRAPGFADLMIGKQSPDDVIYREAGDRFDFIGAGGPTARAFGAPELRRLSAALRLYRDRYDLVVIDTPPLLAMAEALLCAHAADSTVFLCRWNSTRREAVVRCLARLHEAGASVAGLVLSMMDKKQLALFSDEHQSADIKLIEGYYHGG